jgi:hypothetical protein
VFTKAVVSVVPLKMMLDEVTKFDPVAVRVNWGPPADVLGGESKVREGAGSESLGPTTVVGSPEGIDSAAELSPEIAMGTMEGQVVVVQLFMFGELFEVAYRVKLSPALKFVVSMVKVREVGVIKAEVTKASTQASYAASVVFGQV